MHLSYWEKQTWFDKVDFAVVGSGITGLNCALALRKKHPKSKILVLEKGFLPAGASTKNAGFACFGSLTEILEDLTNHSQEEVMQLVKDRFLGLQTLRQTLGDQALRYKNWGGYEIFLKSDRSIFEQCVEKKDEINQMLNPVFQAPVFEIIQNSFGFKNTIEQEIFNPFEGQIDTGSMMQALMDLVRKQNITVLNGVEVQAFDDAGSKVELIINQGLTFEVQKLFVATNGFARQLLNIDLQPARAQVLLTKPIKNLKIKGVFHLDGGYYYFRNIDGRILFGGGRNLDFKTEETTKFGLTEQIQSRLECLLKETILSGTDFEIDQRWCGIMGMGSQKSPIIKAVSENVYCGVRLGGMGVAIGSLIGSKLANFS